MAPWPEDPGSPPLHRPLLSLLPVRSWKVTRAQYDQIVAATKSFSADSLQFMSKVLHRSGLGDETYAPPSECGLACNALVRRGGNNWLASPL